MSVVALMRETDRRLAKWLAAGASPCVHRVLSVVEEAGEGTKLWCGAAAVMVSLGG
ncbi:hypothetical protein ACFY96_28405 [Streptomyces massasporeus]